MAIAEQEIALNALPRFAYIEARRLSRSHQIPHCFMGWIGHPNRHHIASP
jgi:hypothetical protein